MAKGVKGSGLPAEEKPVRTSMNIYPATFRKLRYIALMDDKDLTQLVESSLQMFISKWEKEHGEISFPAGK